MKLLNKNYKVNIVCHHTFSSIILQRCEANEDCGWAWDDGVTCLEPSDAPTEHIRLHKQMTSKTSFVD